jgi:hypothetical protein
LHEQEAVDSESLLDDWTDPVEIETAVTVRSTDLLSKYQQFVFSRRGEFKLAARTTSFPGSLTIDQGRQDRFADNSTLDFLDMGFRDLFDLSTDMSELSSLGNTATATSMLSEMSTYLTQGYSRAGGGGLRERGQLRIGGDLLTDTNWHAYKTIPQRDRSRQHHARDHCSRTAPQPAIIINRTYVHRAGTITYSPGTEGGIDRQPV